MNSVRGPGDDLNRLPLYAAEVPVEVRSDRGVDDFGRLVFAATVTEVRADGSFVLSYDGDGHGVESPGLVTPRVRMPWNPKFLKGQLTIMLRRNLGQGRVLEGLEVRWDLVSRLLGALTRLGPWRLDGSVGPMHKWYDGKLFDSMEPHEVTNAYAARDASGCPVDIRTAEGLSAAGFDVRLLGDGAFDEDVGSVSHADAVVVDARTFFRWLEMRALLSDKCRSVGFSNV